MDLGPEHVTAIVGGGGAAGWLAKLLFDRVFGKALKAEDKVEAEQESKLDKVLALVEEMRRELDVVLERLNQQQGSVGELRERINGVSANHGGRIDTLEKQMVEVRLLQQQPRPRRR